MDISALIDAALHGNLDRLRSELEEGAALDTTSLTGRTALHVAVSSDRSDLVCELLFAGAKVETVDAFGRSPIELARTKAEHG